MSSWSTQAINILKHDHPLISNLYLEYNISVTRNHWAADGKSAITEEDHAIENDILATYRRILRKLKYCQLLDRSRLKSHFQILKLASGSNSNLIPTHRYNNINLINSLSYLGAIFNCKSNVNNSFVEFIKCKSISNGNSYLNCELTRFIAEDVQQYIKTMKNLQENRIFEIEYQQSKLKECVFRMEQKQKHLNTVVQHGIAGSNNMGKTTNLRVDVIEDSRINCHEFELIWSAKRAIMDNNNINNTVSDILHSLILNTPVAVALDTYVDMDTTPSHSASDNTNGENCGFLHNILDFDVVYKETILKLQELLTQFRNNCDCSGNMFTHFHDQWHEHCIYKSDGEMLKYMLIHNPVHDMNGNTIDCQIMGNYEHLLDKSIAIASKYNLYSACYK